MPIPESFTIHFIPEGLFVGRVFGPAHSQISDLRLKWIGCKLRRLCLHSTSVVILPNWNKYLQIRDDIWWELDMWIPDSFTIHFIPEGLFVGRVFGPAHSQISDLRLNWIGCITTAYFPFCYTLTSKKMHFMLSSPHLNFIMPAYLVSLLTSIV